MSAQPCRGRNHRDEPCGNFTNNPSGYCGRCAGARLPAGGGRLTPEQRDELSADPYERPFAHLTPAQVDAALNGLWALRYDLFDRRALVGAITEIDGEIDLTDPAGPGEDLAGVETQLTLNETEIGVYEDEFTARGGWARYLHDQSPNGLVHSGFDCPEATPSARYRILSSWSDRPLDSVLDNIGRRACTTCFPAATKHPRWNAGQHDWDFDTVDHITPGAGGIRTDTTNLEIVGPDGNALRGIWGEIRTLRSARVELATTIAAARGLEQVSPRHPNLPRYREAIAAIAETIAVATNESVDDVLAEAEASARRRGLLPPNE